MVVVRFKTKEHHEDVLKKVKKMKHFIEDLEDMFEECYDDMDEEEYYRSPRYRDEHDEMPEHYRGRYDYRRGGGRGRM